MKKLLFTLLVVVAMCLPQGAVAKSINWTSTALNTTTPVAIDLPSGYCGNVTLYCSDGTLVYLSKDVSKTDERPLWADTSENWGEVCPPNTSSKTVVWARSSVGTPSLILLYNKE